jgi:hypothetical protein
MYFKPQQLSESTRIRDGGSLSVSIKGELGGSRMSRGNLEVEPSDAWASTPYDMQGQVVVSRKSGVPSPPALIDAVAWQNRNCCSASFHLLFTCKTNKSPQ